MGTVQRFAVSGTIHDPWHKSLVISCQAVMLFSVSLYDLETLGWGILETWGRKSRGGAEVNTETDRGHDVYLFPTRYSCHHG